MESELTTKHIVISIDLFERNTDWRIGTKIGITGEDSDLNNYLYSDCVPSKYSCLSNEFGIL